MKKVCIFLGLFVLVFIIVGCSGETTTQNTQEKVVEITPEEWGLISESEQYCQALDYFGLTNEEAADKISECQKGQLSSSLWQKLKKYMSVEQQELRNKISEEKEGKDRRERELYEQEHLNLRMGETSTTPNNLEITLISVKQEDSKETYIVGCENQACANIVAEIEIKNIGNETQRIGLFKVISTDENYVYEQSIGAVGDIQYYKLEGQELGPNQIAKGDIYFKNVEKPATEIFYGSSSNTGDKLLSWKVE